MGGRILHSESIAVAQSILFLFFIVFAAGALGGKIANQMNIPDVAFYVLLGVIMGPEVLGWINIETNSLLNQSILLLGAASILFHGGTVTRFHVLREVWLSILLLSTLGVVVTAFVVGLFGHVIFGLPLLTVLLLGAMLSSTDPAALVPIFQRFSFKPRLAQTVISESAFTDATGAILTALLLGLVISHSTAIHPGNVLLDFLRLSVGGIMIGAVVGYVLVFLMANFFRDYTPTMVTIAILASYLFAEVLHTSGFMSVFTAGLIWGNASLFRVQVLESEEVKVHSFLDTITLKMRMLIFLFLGSQVQFGVLQEFGWQSMLLILVFMLLARPATVLCSTLLDRKAKWSRNEILFLFWTRETGVIVAALSGMIQSQGLPFSKLFSAVVFMAILMTLLIQASTTPWVANKLGLFEESSVGRERVAIED